MSQDRSGAAAGQAAGGATPQPQRWQQLGYPDEATFLTVMRRYRATAAGRHFLELPQFVQLGWPSEAIWELHAPSAAGLWEWDDSIPRPLGLKPWAEVVALYPDRPGVPAEKQDLARMLRFWPKHLGEEFGEVSLQWVEGITINELTYGPGQHRVPRSVAVDLRKIDSDARQSWLDQFIEKKYRDKVIHLGDHGEVLSDGEIRQQQGHR